MMHLWDSVRADFTAPPGTRMIIDVDPQSTL
jgi:DNA primase